MTATVLSPASPRIARRPAEELPGNRVHGIALEPGDWLDIPARCRHRVAVNA